MLVSVSCAKAPLDATAPERAGQKLQVSDPIPLEPSYVAEAVAPRAVTTDGGFWVGYVAQPANGQPLRSVSLDSQVCELNASNEDDSIDVGYEPFAALALGEHVLTAFKPDGDQSHLDLALDGVLVQPVATPSLGSWPALATDGQTAMLAFTSGSEYADQVGTGIATQSLDLNGSETSGSAVIASLDDAGVSTPALAAAPGGPYLAVWSSLDATGAQGIRGARVAPGSGTSLDALGFDIDEVANDRLGYPAVAFGDSHFLVAWEDDDAGTIGGAFVELDGGVGAAQVLGSCNEAYGKYPSLTYANGGFVLAYDCDTGGSTIEVLTLRPDAGTLTHHTLPGPLNDGTPEPLSVAARDDGTMLVAYLLSLNDGGSQATFAWFADADPCATTGDTTTGSTSSGSTSGSGSSGSSSSGSGTTSGTQLGSTSGSTGSSSSTDLFGCSSAGAGLLPLLVVGVLLLKRRRGAALLVLALVITSPRADAQTVRKSKRARIAVLDLDAKLGVDPKLAELVTTRLVAQIQETSGEGVISSSDVKNALGYERERQLLGCTESSCMAELGGALGVDLLVTGTIAHVGKARTFDAQVMDVSKALVLRRYSHRLPDDAGDEAFLDEVAPAAAALFPPTPTAVADVKPSANVAPKPAATSDVSTAPSTERRIEANLLAASELTAKGGLGMVRGGYRVVPAVAVQAGALLAASGKAGALLGIELQPINTEGSLRPLLGASAEALFSSPVSLGAMASVGLEWEPTPGFTLRAEVPLTWLASTPAGARQLYVFGGIGAGLKI